LQGWFNKTANLWQIPLIPVVLNNSTDTVLVNKPPTEFLPDCTPIIIALGQPLRMAAHVSDRGNSSNQCRRGGKWNTMVMMFLGGVVSMLDGILVLFLL
jgi:hypothetical protein